MGNKKKDANFLEEFILRNQWQNFMPQHEQAEFYGNAMQKAEADGMLHEQKRLIQRESDMLHFAMELQKFQGELHKVKKSTDEIAKCVGILTKRYSKMEKRIQEQSEKVHSLSQNQSWQKEKLKKCRLQMHQQKKILRLMGAYMGINNPTDNLGKIVGKCSKQLRSDSIRKSLPIIDADYKEAIN